jgi:hypothetical protein
MWYEIIVSMMTCIRAPVVTNSGLTMVSPVMSVNLLGTACRHDLWWKSRNRSWGAQAWGQWCLGPHCMSYLWAAPHREMLLTAKWKLGGVPSGWKSKWPEKSFFSCGHCHCCSVSPYSVPTMALKLRRKHCVAVSWNMYRKLWHTRIPHCH